LEFQVLGSLEVVSRGRRLPLGGRREKAVLAMLLLEPEHAVLVERLVEAVWDDDPPATAVKQVRNAVARLRGLLARQGADDAIATIEGGYRILVPGELDWIRFQADVDRAARLAADGDLGEAVRALRTALARWRGPALAGMTGRVLTGVAAAWDERRLAAQLTCAGHQLALGRHEQAVPELVALAGDHPLRPRPVELLMLALYRGGRQADALAAYYTYRTRLAEETGLDPSPDLQDLCRRIFAGDESLAAPQSEDSEPPVREARRTPPARLPAAARHFTGRSDHLRGLDDLLEQEVPVGGSGLIATIEGAPGTGKSALAVTWAHHVADRFPDGRLYLDLRGFAPAGAPMGRAEAVRLLLEELEAGPEREGLDVPAQLALYRDLMADRRALVVLDNARDAEQVRPLLPRGRACVAVVTSRWRLTGLAVAEGAHPIGLGSLTTAEARELLRVRLGADRVATEQAAAEEIAESCARLPLALSIVCAHAAGRSGLSLADIATRLRNPRRRLDVLSTGDPLTDVRAVFSWSYQHLDEGAARMFRLLGQVPTTDVSLPAAAGLAAVPWAEAHRVLQELTHANLLHEHSPGRYAFLDLLRLYAAELAQQHDEAGAGAGAGIEMRSSVG